jgi:ATP-dependent helicase/nuclease subunit B
VVVPTAQRAVALRLAFAARQLAMGRRAFRTPDVQSLSGWLRGQPRLGSDARALRRLGGSEEWLLWREAVAEAAARWGVPAGAGLVEAVRQSAALLYEWQIAPGELRRAATPEAALLSEALTAMDARLMALSAAAPWRALQELAESPPRRLPLFVGFAFHTPARRALLAAWTRRGEAAQEPIPPGGFAAAPARMAHCADPTEELQQVAQWCRERLHHAPAARLLVVVPQLARRRGEIRRVFDAVLDPDYLHRPAAQPDGAAYALEGGQSLLEFAPVAEGLRTLQMLTCDVELTAASQWLRGTAWPAHTATQRAQLDVWLRTVVPPRLNIGQLLRALRAAPPALLAAADEVAALILQAQRAVGDGARATLAQWSGRFARMLAMFDLTASAARQRGSHAQQVLQRLDELLQECAALPAALGSCDALEALQIFTQLLSRTRFEPATGDAAVTLTASFADPILRYEGIWVSGLHAGAIPEQARFDPFIPVSLQRQAGITAADAAALVGQAQQALATLCRSSREFIVSAPHQAEDTELAASPLLAPYSQQRYSAAHGGLELSHAIRAARRTERYVDEPGLPWAAALPLPAGTRAIELQSRCPFRAYAQLRLGADPMESPLPGITPRERGRMLHRALELLWQGLGDSQALAAARADQSLGWRIDDAIVQAADEILAGTDPDGAQDAAFTAAADATGLKELRRAAIGRERGRAGRLLRSLCELEAARAPFFISELETAHRLEIAGALIDVRIDRVDRLQDGTHAILDYKSGRTVTPDWDVERTTHPQLLVYQLAAGVAVSALAVAHLDPKSVAFKGIADLDSRLPGLKTDENWAAQLGEWRRQVAQLAADFLHGHAGVEPMDRACDHCHLHAFCRIAEVREERP